VKRGKRRGTREKETDSGLGLPDSGRDEPQGWPLRGRDNNAVTKKGCRIPASGVGKKTEDGKEGLRESGFGHREGKSRKPQAARLGRGQHESSCILRKSECVFLTAPHRRLQQP